MTEFSPPTTYHQVLEELLAPQPTVIGLEGGPCSGKTTLINRLGAVAADAERSVVIVPEAATQHIEVLHASGVSIMDLMQHDRPAFLQLEQDILATIAESVRNARQAAAGTDTIIVADRVDISAYVTPDEFKRLLVKGGMVQPPYLEHVDSVAYLPSVARENPVLYASVKATNAARYEEDAETAAAVCQANLAAVGDHPELTVYWGGEFQEKIAEAADDILHPEREVEAKYLQTDPSAWREVEQAIPDLEPLSRTGISQSYHAFADGEFRLRAGLTDKGFMFHHFAVKTGSGNTRRELRRIVDEWEYGLLRQAPRTGRLDKVRQTFLGTVAGRRRVIGRDTYHGSSEADYGHWMHVVEIDGLDEEAARSVTLPGHEPTDLSARDLAQ